MTTAPPAGSAHVRRNFMLHVLDGVAFRIGYLFAEQTTILVAFVSCLTDSPRRPSVY